MDLRAWLLEAHSDLRRRLFGGVIGIVPSDRWTEQADGGGSSIAWLVLHLARHQDLAIATAIRNHAPLFAEHQAALGLVGSPPWSGIPEREDRYVTATVASSDALVPYVEAVFDATTQWFEQLVPSAMESTPDTPRRLAQLAHLPTDQLAWLFAMWGSRDVGWFVHWPVLGHGNAHVGEAISVRNRLGFTSF